MARQTVGGRKHTGQSAVSDRRNSLAECTQPTVPHTALYHLPAAVASAERQGAASSLLPLARGRRWHAYRSGGPPIAPDQAHIFFQAATMEVLHKRWIVRDGERWTVSEVDARDVPGTCGDSCLICESDLSVRRLWRYPADWNGMDDAGLLDLFAAPLVRSTPTRAIERGVMVER